MHTEAGDIAVTEAPTYYLAHQMFRERGLVLREVPLEDDGMDVDALEKLCEEMGGKVKLVYTVPIHHNPTGVTMSDAIPVFGLYEFCLPESLGRRARDEQLELGPEARDVRE